MYLIGVDGGGTKTTVALTNENGEILSVERGDISNWRNVGVDASIDVVFDLIKKVKKEKKISLSYIALSAIEEEQREKKDYFIKKIKEKGLEGEVFLGSDQIVAFRAGTEKKDGVVVICGTGAVVCGWKDGKKIKASGWGYFADEGSAFYVGIEGYRRLLKILDGREEESEIKKIVLEEWGIKTAEELNERVYNDFIKTLPLLSVIVGKAGEKGDKKAISILEKAAEEVFFSIEAVVVKTNFEENFPIVLSGGMFNSNIFLSYL